MAEVRCSILMNISIIPWQQALWREETGIVTHANLRATERPCHILQERKPTRTGIELTANALARDA